MENQNFHSMDNKVIYYDTLIKVSPKARAFELWEFSNDLNLTGINRKGVLELLTQHGFYKRKTPNGSIETVHIKNGVIKFTAKNDILIYLKDYIENENGIYRVYQSQYSQNNYKLIETEQFINLFLKQHHLLINDSFLGLLELNNSEVLKDTKDKAYLFFKNVVVAITKDSIEEKKYEDFENLLVFESDIIARAFKVDTDWKKAPFSKFVKNITNDDVQRKCTVRSALGYLLHGYNDPASSQAVILYDEELTDINTPKGGTGKGIIGQALSKVKKGFIQLDGKKTKLDAPFTFQRVKEDTKIIFIDDVGRNFDIDALNSILTEGITTEAKFKTAIHIAKSNMPKFLIASNVILPFEGTTRMRRQYIIELSNHYSKPLATGKSQPIISEHGKRFFDEWDETEWNGFYTFIIKSIQYYLAKGLIKPPMLNVKKNRVIQKIGEHLYRAFEEMEFKMGQEYSTQNIYEHLKEQEVIETVTKRNVTDSLKLFLTSTGIEFQMLPKQKIKILDK